MVEMVLLPCDGKVVCQQHERLASLLPHLCWGEQQSEVSMTTTINLAIKRAAISLLAILLQCVDWIWGWMNATISWRMMYVYTHVIDLGREVGGVRNGKYHTGKNLRTGNIEEKKN